MHNKFSRRNEQALERLSARIARSKKPLDPAAVSRQIGRVFQQNQRAAARFAIALSPTPVRRAFASASITTPRSTIGPPSRRAPISCVRTSGIGATDSFGRPTSNSLRPRRLSHSQRSAEPASDLASARGPGPGPHPRLLPRLRALEEPGDLAGARGPRQPAADHPRRTGAHPAPRRRLPTAAHGEIRLRCVAQPDAAQAALLTASAWSSRAHAPPKTSLRSSHSAPEPLPLAEK